MSEKEEDKPINFFDLPVSPEVEIMVLRSFLEAEVTTTDKLRAKISSLQSEIERLKKVIDPIPGNTPHQKENAVKSIVSELSRLKGFEVLYLNGAVEILALKQEIERLRSSEGVRADNITIKPNSYDQDGDLEGMDVGDYIVTKAGKVRKITSDEMSDLHYTEIARYATTKEIKGLAVEEKKEERKIILKCDAPTCNNQATGSGYCEKCTC